MYDYADVLLPMLARMYKKRLAGTRPLGMAFPTARWPECGISGFAACLRIRSWPPFSSYFALFGEDYVWDWLQRNAEMIPGVATLTCTFWS